jgi:hypothetical protein
MYSAVSRVEPLPLSLLPRSVYPRRGGAEALQTGRQAERNRSLDGGESVGVEVFYRILYVQYGGLWPCAKKLSVGAGWRGVVG